MTVNYNIIAQKALRFLFEKWYVSLTCNHDATTKDYVEAINDNEVLSWFHDSLGKGFDSFDTTANDLKQVLLEAYAPKADDSNQYIYRCYFIAREPDIGTYPKVQKPLHIQVFKGYRPVENINHNAYGYIDFAKPLTKDELFEYDLKMVRIPKRTVSIG